MLAPSQSAPALAVLHYISPIATAFYFLSAKTTAACLLQKPSGHAVSKFRRYTAIALQLCVALTAVVESTTSIFQAVEEPTQYASKDYVIYLAVTTAVHISLALGILESKAPIWHPYLGAWLFAFGFDVPIIALQGLRLPGDYFARVRLAFAVIRVLFLLLLCLITSYFMLNDRRRRIKLDSESEALLANTTYGSFVNGCDQAANGPKPALSPADSLFPGDDSHETSEDEDGDEDYDLGFDSETEDPEEDKKVRAQQRQRLKEAGSWLNYLREYKIFVKMLIPSKDRYVQASLVIISVAIIAERALNILVPRQIGIITDELAKNAGNGVVPWRAIGLWVLYASLNSDCGITLVKSLAELPIEQYGYKAIATTAFSHIMGLSMDFHGGKNSGELIRVIEQGTNLQNLVNFIFFQVAPMFFDLIAAFIYVATLFDIYMSMILFIAGAGYIWVGAKMAVWSVKARRDYNTASLLESKVKNEAINSFMTVSHFNRGKYETERYSSIVDHFNQVEWRYWLSYYLGGQFQGIFMLIGEIAALTLGAYRVSQGAAPLGNFVTLFSYWSSIQAPLSNVSQSVRRVSQMLTDSERLLQLLTTKATISDAPDAVELDIKHGSVTFSNVSFAYDPRKPTLEDISFTVKPGQTIALVGETGGGKSTILKLLYRYYDVSRGAIQIDGQDIRSVTLDSLRDAFGMVPQDPSLFNMSILDNIKYARLDATDAEVHEACKAAAIHDKILSFPDQYASTVGERGVKLSGGELQRVAIARAILRKPKIVLLDEATSMIDAETEAVIQAAFEKLTKSRTTFVVAHRLSTIQHADLILVVGEGGILERGTHEELLRLEGKYVRLWKKQASKEIAVKGLVELDGEALIGRGEEEGNDDEDNDEDDDDENHDEDDDEDGK